MTLKPLSKPLAVWYMTSWLCVSGGGKLAHSWARTHNIFFFFEMLASWLETWFMFLILFIYLKFSNLNVKTSGSNQVSPEIWSEQCSTGFFSYRTVLIWSLLCFFFFFLSEPQKPKLWATSHDILLPHSIPTFSCFFSCWGVGVCVYVCVHLLSIVHAFPKISVHLEEPGWSIQRCHPLHLGLSLSWHRDGLLTPGNSE